MSGARCLGDNVAHYFTVFLCDLNFVFFFLFLVQKISLFVGGAAPLEFCETKLHGTETLESGKRDQSRRFVESEFQLELQKIRL